MPQSVPPIRILHLEDNPRDVELVRDLLATDGIVCELLNVASGQAFEQALATPTPAFDLVLTDFNVPGYDGISALHLVRGKNWGLPVIVISGSIGEDAAVKCLHLGATDYLLKDRLDRLPSAVRRALQHAEGEQKRRVAEDALRASEERFSLVAQATSDAIWDWNLSTRQVWWGGRFELFSDVRSAAVGNDVPPWLNHVHPQDRARVHDKVAATLERAASVWLDEYRFLRRDGSYAIVSNRGFIVRDANGQATRMVGGMTDITENKLAEERFTAMFHSSPLAIGFETCDGRILDANARFFEFFGFSRDEMIGRTSGELALWVKPEERAHTLAVLSNRKPLRGYEGTFRRKSGEIRNALISVEVLELGGEPLHLIMIVDITERKALETQLQRMQRVESVGRLASGIAHDMNNILAPIMMSAPLLRMGIPRNELEKIVSTIETSAQRGAALVRQLLLFGRGVEGDRRPVNLETIVADVAKISAQTFSRNISLTTKVATDTWQVHGDATQLHQVLLNLCVNARDAMSEGGLLSIATENVEIDELHAATHRDARPGKYVVLRVVDTGAGIPPEVVDRIFDPFFTTKEPGKGTGLGLSTVLGIVKGHGGFIRLDSVVGSGTTFEIYLPADGVNAVAAPAANNAGTIPRGKGELILVVDDEENIRGVLRDTFVRHGYRVVSAPNGVEATAVFSANPEVKLIITDLDMPFMDGVSLARVLRQMKPTLKFVISTGGSARSGIGKRKPELDALGIKTVLTKPYSAEQLLSCVHSVLT